MSSPAALPLASIATLALALAGAPSVPAPEGAAAAAYETPPVLQASDFLEPALLKGPNHEIAPTVSNDGVFNLYRITTPNGTSDAQGTSLVPVRVGEINAIALLKDVDKIAVGAKGVVGAVVDSGKGAVQIVTHPVQTVIGLGDGAKRLFGRISRGIRRASEQESSESKSGGKQVADTSRNLAEQLIGVNYAVRTWAKKLNVDPYTPNVLLHDELLMVARYDAGGRLTVKAAPIGAVGTALGAAATVNDLVWEKDADELQTLNEKRLAAMGATPEQSRAFRLNKNYGLSRQTALVAHLDALAGVPGRSDFVERAADAASDADAQFWVEASGLLDDFHHREAPLEAIAPDVPGACGNARGGRFACFFALDYVVWTESVAAHFERLTAKARTDFPKSRREVWITGRVSPRTAAELAQREWTVRAQAAVIPPAAPTPAAAAPSPGAAKP